MVEGRRREAWTHTSSLIALIYNALSDEPKSPDDFNPYAIRQKETEKKEDVKILRDIFFDSDNKYKGPR